MKKENWLLAILLIIVLAIAVSTVWITNNRIVDRAELNQKEFIEVISSLRSEPKIFSDTLKGSRIEQSKRLQESIVTLATLQLNDYHKMVIEEASANKVTLTLWATLLTLLSIVFTFLGIMELKEKIKEINNIQTVIENKNEELAKYIKKEEAELEKNFESKNKELTAIEERAAFKLTLQSALLQVSINLKIEKVTVIIDQLGVNDKRKRAEALYILALLYISNREDDKALECLNKAIMEDVTVGIYRFEQASIYMRQASDFQKKDPGLATSRYKSAITNFDVILAEKMNIDTISSDQIHFNVGVCYSRLADIYNNENENDITNAYKDAKNSYGKAIEINATKAKYYYERGIVNLNIDDFDAAHKDFVKSYKIDDKDEAHYYAGMARLKGPNKNILDAKEEFLIASTKREVADYLYELGFCYYELKEFNECCSKLEEAIKIDPDHIHTSKAHGKINDIENKNTN